MGIYKIVYVGKDFCLILKISLRISRIICIIPNQQKSRYNMTARIWMLHFFKAILRPQTKRLDHLGDCCRRTICRNHKETAAIWGLIWLVSFSMVMASMLTSLVSFINDFPMNSLGPPMLTGIIMDTIPKIQIIRILEPTFHPMEFDSFSEICSLIVLFPHLSSLKFTLSILLRVAPYVLGEKWLKK